MTVAVKVTSVPLVGLEGEKVKSADKATAAIVTLADFVCVFGVGVAESVPVTLMLKVLTSAASGVPASGSQQH